MTVSTLPAMTRFGISCDARVMLPQCHRFELRHREHLTTSSQHSIQGHIMATPASSYAHIDHPISLEETESLPSTSASSNSSSGDDEYEESDAEREWRESLQQLELLLTMVLVPYLGKYFGRKCAYWGESRATHAVERLLTSDIAWAKYMEWQFPVSVEFSSKRTFKITGAVEAAAAL